MNKPSNLLFQNLIAAKEVGQRLGVNVKTVYEWARQGKIPSKRINGVLRFCPRELAEWLRNKGDHYGKSKKSQFS